MNASYVKFCALAARWVGENPAQRIGQAHFNCLRVIHPEIAEQVHGDLTLDPFYVDDRLPAFLAFVRKRLEEAT